MMWLIFGCLESKQTLEPSDPTIDEGSQYSEGCDIIQNTGVEQRTLNTGEGTRGYHLVVPETYDASVPSRLIFGFAGTNWVGEQI